MRLTYTGRKEEFTPAQNKKLDAKFLKLAKLLDLKGGEREAHVILNAERHLRHAEITVRSFAHPMVGEASGADQFSALLQAVERLEKQVLKLRTKKRDTKRDPKQTLRLGAPAAEFVPPVEEPAGAKVFRLNEASLRKPMTLEEALLELDQNLNYFVFRDAETDRLSVLLRRRDGHFDLVEA